MTFQPPSNPLPTPVIHSSNLFQPPYQPPSNPLPTPSFQPPYPKGYVSPLGGGTLPTGRKGIAAMQTRLVELLAEVRALRLAIAEAEAEQ
jgi:hypothetical protein